MRVTVLGSSGTYPSPANPASSFLISTDTTAIWCDAGPGSFQALARVMDPSGIAGVVLSHRHSDHCIDLLAAYHTLAYRPGQVERLPVLADQSVVDRLLAFLDAGDDHTIHSVFRFDPPEDGVVIHLGNVSILPVAMSHSAPTFGSVFDADGKRVFYTADTGRGPWEERISDVDLLICEATFQTSDAARNPGGHLTAREAGEIATRVGAARLLLTHVPPHLDPAVSVLEAEDTFGGPVMMAEPGATHEV